MPAGARLHAIRRGGGPAAALAEGHVERGQHQAGSSTAAAAVYHGFSVGLGLIHLAALS